MATTDYYIGQIVDKLESLQLRENSIVIYMSDNGHSEETGNKIRVDGHRSGLPKDHFYGASGGGSTGKWIGHKGNFLEGGVRVPAILSYPAKVKKRGICNQVVTAMDWFPTVLELCGIEPAAGSPKLDGHSVLPLIQDRKAKSKHGVLHFAWGKNWAVRESRWKLIAHVARKTGKARFTLHNLAEAQPEVKDYAKEKPETVARLRKLHEAWANDVGMP
jgi:arylsulfatase A